MLTGWPWKHSRRRRITRLAPINPALPVTNIFIGLFDFLWGYQRECECPFSIRVKTGCAAIDV